jgi:hypothetical protein
VSDSLPSWGQTKAGVAGDTFMRRPCGLTALASFEKLSDGMVFRRTGPVSPAIHIPASRLLDNTPHASVMNRISIPSVRRWAVPLRRPHAVAQSRWSSTEPPAPSGEKPVSPHVKSTHSFMAHGTAQLMVPADRVLQSLRAPHRQGAPDVDVHIPVGVLGVGEVGEGRD